MAGVKISELTSNTAPVASDIAAVSKSDASATNKVTLQKIAQLFSDNTGITGADRIANIVSLSQQEYDALTPGDTDATTLYIILGSSMVLPSADVTVSGITDGSGAAMNGAYIQQAGYVGEKNWYLGPTMPYGYGPNLSGRTIIVFFAANGEWRIGYESSETASFVDTGYYWYSTQTNGLLPPTTGWTGVSMAGTVTVVVH